MTKIDLSKPPMSLEESEQLLKGAQDRASFWTGTKLLAGAILLVAFAVLFFWSVSSSTSQGPMGWGIAIALIVWLASFFIRDSSR
ncbi:MAG: hypothetical protein WBF84_06720 [Castellaniella sp.]|uniref:hypothetical protein n=1 Tax=Castellaniella sp. TaxID=1955812 RepID=UPI003C734EEF